MLYLASRSPQRSLLLAQAGIEFRLVESAADEETIVVPHPQAMALERARIKAASAVLEAVLPNWSDADCVLAADTVVSHGGRVYGKPADAEDAVRILTALAGTTHVVTTAHCCRVPPREGRPAVEACGVSLARVTMRRASEAEIRAYVATGESAARSGAYAIQESGDRFIIDREGEFDTVVGLHLTTVRRLYHECTGLRLPGDESLPEIGVRPPTCRAEGGSR